MKLVIYILFLIIDGNFECTDNNIEINGDLYSLTSLINAESSKTVYNNNIFTINGNLSYLYGGYEFLNNTVTINSEFGKLNNYSQAIFNYSNWQLLKDINIDNNKIYLNCKEDNDVMFFIFYNGKINGHNINIENNLIEFNTDKIHKLIHLQNITDGEQQNVYINNNTISCFKKILFYNNTVNPIVHFDGKEITTNTTLE